MSDVPGEASPQQMQQLLARWAAGRITLKELKGYSDDELYAIAHTGYFFLMQGKNNEARTLFEGLVAIDPKNDYYYRALGVIFHKLGDAERAIKQFSYAIQVSPKTASSYVNRAEVHLSLGRSADAAADLRKALELVSPREPALARKARALLGVVTRRR
ncbi:MAG TPA: tetratricopeptide repeat protein [Myxococcota bacterium]